MKTIAIDLSPAELNPAGIGIYTINLTQKLIDLDKKNKYLLYTTLPFDKIKFNSDRVENVVIPFPKKYRARGIRWMMNVTKDLKARKVDLLLSYSNHFFSLSYPNTVQFIHDLAPIKYPKFFPVKARMIYPFTTRMALQKAKKVVTVSNTVKKELQSLWKMPNDKVEIVYPARNELAHITNDNYQAAKPLDLPKKYLLSVGTLEPRKNLDAAIKAFAKLRQEQKIDLEIKYVIAGKKGWYYKDIFKLVSSLGLENDVVFAGYVADDLMPEVFKNAIAFIYLSHYEGFGMPALEALTYNKPTLLSDIPVLKESFVSWAKFANPNNVEEIAEKLVRVINGKKKNVADAVMEKFSWELSANKLLGIIEQLTKTTKK